MAKSTLEEVAKRVGVSARTVSRVVNNESGYSEATRQRVQEAIDETGYRPNLRARSLVTNRSDTVGFVAAFFTDPYFPEVADAVGAELGVFGQTMLMAPHHENPEQQRRIVDSLISHAVDGIIVFPAHLDNAPVVEAADLGIPVVVVDEEIAHPRIGGIMNDIRGGARLAVDHLLDEGHTAIGAVMNISSRRGGKTWREETFTKRLSNSGIAGHRVELAEPTIAGGMAAAERLFEAYPDTTAVLAYNDLMAVGVLLAASAGGRRVPDDVAIVGFDDIELATALSPALTTVRLDRQVVGRLAVDMLEKMIADPAFEPGTVTVPTHLVRRQSA